MRPRSLLAAIVLVSAVASTAVAQAPDTTKSKPAAAEASAVGTWTGSVETPNGAMSMTAIIKKDSTTYTGVMTGETGEMELYDVTVAGEKVSAGATMNMQGTAIELWYEFVMKGNTMSGSVSANVGGESMSFPLVLTRVVAP
ncbi:MAG: hypothetical protein O2973_12105 [Gemmatimonadetes bacterium]|nr:hypothetical protein [Gemmatimonadota bacterium]